jgi:opacity protein-like surface antigen
MQKLIKLAVFFVSLVFVVPLVAQSIVIKPYYAYLHLLPQMKDVNNQITRQVEEWREELKEPISLPGKFNGDNFFGVQIQYYLNNNYVLALDFFYYRETVGTTYDKFAAAPPYLFSYARRVESFDVILNLHYYFDYNQESRFNKYIGLGSGLVFAKAKSITGILFYGPEFPSRQSVYTQGSFSKTSLTAVISAGADFRLFNFISLWGEAGYQYAKVGQMEGTVRPLDDTPNATFPTEASFDFSGFYFRTGLGIRLPF